MTNWQRIALIVALISAPPLIENRRATKVLCEPTPNVPLDTSTGLPSGASAPDSGAEELKKLCEEITRE